MSILNLQAELRLAKKTNSELNVKVKNLQIHINQLTNRIKILEAELESKNQAAYPLQDGMLKSPESDSAGEIESGEDVAPVNAKRKNRFGKGQQ